MRTKILVAIFLIVILCFSACSPEEVQSIQVCTDKSFLIDFYEENGIVHFVCRIELYNNTAENLMVKICGISQEDVAGGLLADPYLTGYNIEDQSDTFIINANGHCLIVVDFCGVYAGVLEKKDRLIPDIIEIEVVG